MGSAEGFACLGRRAGQLCSLRKRGLWLREGRAHRLRCVLEEATAELHSCWLRHAGPGAVVRVCCVAGNDRGVDNRLLCPAGPTGLERHLTDAAVESGSVVELLDSPVVPFVPFWVQDSL